MALGGGVRRLHLKSGFVQKMQRFRGFPGVKGYFCLKCSKGSWIKRLAGLSGGIFCARAWKVCARACFKMTIDHKPHSVHIINKHPELSRLNSCLLSYFTVHARAHSLCPCRRVRMCAAIDYKRPLLMSHPPLSTVLSSTADCDGDASSLVLSCYSHLDFLF